MTYTLALIGARAGSSLKDKNIRKLSGFPLLAYSIRAAQKTVNIDRVIVSTDSGRYAEVAKEYGAEVPFLRPAKLSGPQASDFGFIEHALSWLKENESLEPELIIHLRPTTPLRDPGVIAAAIATLREENTSLRSVQPMPESAYKCFEIQEGMLRALKGISMDASNNARQKFPDTFCANGYVDVLRTSFIRSSGLLHGDRVRPFITHPVTEVDTEEDFEFLQFQILRHPGAVERLFGDT